MTRHAVTTAMIAAALLAGCQRPAVGDDRVAAPVGGTAKVAGELAPLGTTEPLRLIGTEPFWSATVAGARLTYRTPRNGAGETVAVKRVIGNNGLGFSGALAAGPIDLAVAIAPCGDGMSDRAYPLTATLRIGGDQRLGCAWSANHPFRNTPHQ